MDQDTDQPWQTPSDFDIAVAHFTVLAGFLLFQAHLQYYSWRGDTKLTLYNPAAAAKSLQSCPTLQDPMDSSPPGSSVHRIL